MHRRRVSRAILSPLLVLLVCCASSTTTTNARVIGVGPDQEVRTLNAALSRAKVGDEIVLDRAIEHATAGVVVRVDAIEIRSADGPGEPATIRNISTEKWPATIEHRAEGLILRDLIMAGAEGVNVTAVRAKGERLIVDNVTPASSMWRFVHLDGARQTVVRNCTAPVLTDYTVCSFGADSHRLLVERCNFAGSTKEHCMRYHRIHDLVLRDSTFRVGGKKSALNLRDGAGVRAENCTFLGPVGIGPLADADGGINHPMNTPEQRAKREAMLRLSLRDVTFKNCTIDTQGITVEMGVQNLLFDACWIKTSRPWVLRLNRDEYEPWRCVPNGRIVHCELTGPAGLRPFERDRPDFHVIRTVINGEQAPDTLPTTRPDEPGGAVPGEVPTTKPTTKPVEQAEVRREDVIAALGRVDDALAQLNVARERLHSSTQPVAGAQE
jgi:hypothetical protein